MTHSKILADPPLDPSPLPASAGTAGYFELLSSNADFRRLWIANLVSLLGDWFNTLALYALVSDLTGSPLALGIVFVCKLLPSALASPAAGILADRMNRRRLMIATDLLRAAVVLPMVLVDRPSEVPLLYLLIALQVSIGAAFEPARSASLPMITSPRELLTANTLMGVSWSVMLALGAASGGLVTAWLGPRSVFVLDAVTYLVSAAFLLRTRIPQNTDPVQHASVVRETLSGIAEGWRYLRTHAPVLRMGVVKATWSVGGGGLVYTLAVLGGQLSPTAPAIGMGMLLAARGVGTGVGPVLARGLLHDQRRWPFYIAVSLSLGGALYATIGVLPWSYWIVLPVFGAHIFGGTQWVYSAVLLQERTIDRYRGRIFATEWLGLQLTSSLSILATSVLLETRVLGLRGVLVAVGGAQVLLGLLWAAWALPQERADAARRRQAPAS